MAIKVALKELCTIEITDGTHKTPEYSDQGYIFLSSKNVTSEKIDWKNVMYIPESLHQELYQRLAPQKDDILLAKNGTTGVAAIVDRDEVFDIYVSLALIRPNQKKVIPRYLLYAINSDSTKRYFRSHLKGVGVPNLHLIHIRETPINVPNIQAQLQIVKKLDKVSDLIAKRRQQLDKLDTLVKARFVEMFGDPVRNSLGFPVKSMTEICNIIDGDRGKNYPRQDELFENEYCLFLNAKNVTSDGFCFENCTYITKEKDNSLHNGKLQRGDVVLTTRGTIGNLAFYDIKIPFENIRINSGMVILRMVPDIVSEVFFIEQFKLQLQSIKEKIASGSAQPQLPVSAMNKIKFIIPPILLQKQYADYVRSTQDEKDFIICSLEKLVILKKAIMQKYFY